MEEIRIGSTDLMGTRDAVYKRGHRTGRIEMLKFMLDKPWWNDAQVDILNEWLLELEEEMEWYE